MLAYERALFTRQTIDQRGLADIRSPDDRDANFIGRLGLRCSRIGQVRRDRVEELKYTIAMLGRDF